MGRNLDVGKVEAALVRAAFKATHGTRAERAGRFLPTKKRRSLPTGNVSRERALTRHKA
jgi:hypothetical protein